MSILLNYLNTLRGKSIAVIGMGVSNAPLVTKLCEAGLSVTVRDRAQREQVSDRATQFEALGATLQLGEGYLDGLEEDIIFRTPGLSPNTPELLDARAGRSTITSEMELFFHLCPCHIIGVTGSDGKTTTTSIIGELLRHEGYTVWVGGNIGTPLLCEVDNMTADDWAVLELSSFQLMGMTQSPQVAVFTNLSPNHLDYHHTMAEYQEAKTNIFAHQSTENLVIFNCDNEITHQLAPTAPGQVMEFSRQQDLPQGICLRGNVIWMAGKEILSLKDILLPGTHNIENYMAAIAATRNLVSVDTIREVAATFGGVEHRMQLVRELNGVQYYNDSIGTSPTRTIACLNALSRPVVLIAGGYDKGVPFDTLAEVIAQRVRVLVLTGVTAPLIEAAMVKQEPHNIIIVKESDFTDAVQRASQLAEEGDCVVLSPACASFDQFKNFVLRGNRFCEIVSSLGEKGE